MTDQATEPRRSELLNNDVPVWDRTATAAPAALPSSTARPTAPAPVNAAPRQTRPAEPNLPAMARVDFTNAALAWVKAELRTEAKLAELRAQLDKAIALGVPRDVLLGLVVDACKRHNLSPAMLSDGLLSALGVAPSTAQADDQTV